MKLKLSAILALIWVATAAFGGDQLAALHWANREKLVGKVLKFKYQKYGSQLITAADRPGIPR